MTLLMSCSETDKKLPVFGHTTIVGSDTIYAPIQPFSFVSQDSQIVTNETFNNKIYVADFIFLSCPSICPVMTSELKKVYEIYKTNPHVCFLSHTIDPKRDSIPRLKLYSTTLGVDSSKWFFVTGNKDSIYSIAEKSYFSAAFPNKDAPGGYLHSGSFLLIDINRHIRGVYDGTNSNETEKLITDLKTLLAEQFQ